MYQTRFLVRKFQFDYERSSGNLDAGVMWFGLSGPLIGHGSCESAVPLLRFQVIPSGPA
jgi:hypothetical protein